MPPFVTSEHGLKFTTGFMSAEKESKIKLKITRCKKNFDILSNLGIMRYCQIVIHPNPGIPFRWP